MKTTIELPDELFKEAKEVAARRGTTLKEIVTHALRKELHPPAKGENVFFQVDEDGLPYLPSRGVKVDSENVYRLLDEEFDR